MSDPEEHVVTHMTQSELIDPKVAELLSRIRQSTGKIRNMLTPNGQSWAIAHCNQIEKDLEEIKAMLRLGRVR